MPVLGALSSGIIFRNDLIVSTHPFLKPAGKIRVHSIQWRRAVGSRLLSLGGKLLGY
jgi:hypothetical protein